MTHTVITPGPRLPQAAASCLLQSIQFEPHACCWGLISACPTSWGSYSRVKFQSSWEDSPVLSLWGHQVVMTLVGDPGPQENPRVGGCLQAFLLRPSGWYT